MSQQYTYTYDVFGNISGVFPIENRKMEIEEPKTEKEIKAQKKAVK